MACCDIFEVFDEKSNLIKEYEHWKLLIRNKNTTLGNCVAITKRHREQFSEVTPEEMKEFAQVVKEVENALKQAFHYDKINYLMLMMKDKHTHFHIIPRYAEKRSFAGMTWEDSVWPKAQIYFNEDVSQEILQEVKAEITPYIKQ